MRYCRLNLVNITLPPKSWVSLNAPCFEISKMWSTVFVPSELTEIFRNLFKTKIIKFGWSNLEYLRLFKYDTKKEGKFYQVQRLTMYLYILLTTTNFTKNEYKL